MIDVRSAAKFSSVSSLEKKKKGKVAGRTLITYSDSPSRTESTYTSEQRIKTTIIVRMIRQTVVRGERIFLFTIKSV